MIKTWSKFNESFKRGERIESLIELIKELSYDLTDIGLKVEIWNGTWKDNGMTTLGKDGYDLPSKSIIMLIEDSNDIIDDDCYYENELLNKPQILQFQERLKDFGLSPSYVTGFSDKVYIFIDKNIKLSKELLRMNENISDDFQEKLTNKMMEVREVFSDFEDLDIVSYYISTNGYERGSGVSFNPKTGDFNRFMDMVVPSVKYSLNPETNFGGHRIKIFGQKSKSQLTDKNLLIIADLKIPAKPNSSGNTLITSEGIKLFEDILVANSRLIDLGYDVMLDMNASHNAYKPAKFLIYFNI